MDDSVAVQRFTDIRRWVATRTLGSARIMVMVQSAMEDIEGAIDAGQFEMAALRTREAVHELASIQSLAAGGHYNSNHDEMAFDPFDRVDPDEWDELLRLPAAVLAGGQAAKDAFAQVVHAANEAEQSLNLAKALPEMRSADGMFSTLRLAREAIALAGDLGIMPVVPDDWTSDGN